MTGRRPPAPPVGLCDDCAQQQVVLTTRGSRFSLCRRSKEEPDRFPRYPRLPVVHCRGFQPREGAAFSQGNPEASPSTEAEAG